MGDRIVYQVQNFNREEMFFGTTDVPLEEEIKKLARNPRSPAGGWGRGDLVSWRPLTPLISEKMANTLHKQFESKTPPNKFKVIPTFQDPTQDG